MAWEDQYDNARRVAFFSKERRNTRGEGLFDFGCPFHLININGETFYETRPAVTTTLVETGLPLGQVREVYTELQRIELDQVSSYNTDAEIATFEMHSGV